MKQAIITKYLGPSGKLGARVKATCAATSLTVPWDYAFESSTNHGRAAMNLAQELGWDRRSNLVGGYHPDGNGYCFVLVPKEQGEL